ncbi:IS3 family transposase [Hymenobacter sp. GOD-10R]|uniref:IS3 family transposase n=1 Tax=Hymenobacter sp. GOD-10R TaxID=3093922 RepID=UPI002D795755|nr:IS3 family transposase [Hymenobacter sp. GOD-10R]WRQ31712.1 IS3 family transposase [Hymenobacter sp. GOD-10R]
MRVGRLCRLFGVSRQAFYRKEQYAQRARGQALLVLDLVLALRREIPGLGTRKLHMLLQEPLTRSGIKMGRDKLHQLLHEHGLLLRQPRQVPKTTNSLHSLRKYPNLLRNQLLTAPRQVWVSDITYLCIGLGFGYLSLITDAYSKMIMGYCLHPLLTAEGAINALDMALSHGESSQELIHHSDRGSQYCSFQYVQKLRRAGIAISMTENGDPYENAIAERVNGILKIDFHLNRVFTTFEEAQRAVEASIRNYNHLRPHMSCGYLTPAAAHASTQPLQQRWRPKVYPSRKTPTADKLGHSEPDLSTVTTSRQDY